MQLCKRPNTLDSSARIAVEQLKQQESCYDHVILKATSATTNTASSFQLFQTGVGGLDTLRAKLRGRHTQFALLRVQGRILLIVSLGQDNTGLKRAHVLIQGRTLQASLGAVLFATISISAISELTSALVGSKLQLQGFAHVDEPNTNQDFRASWASTSAASIVSRAQPSAPTSPEELDHDTTNWSRLGSDLSAARRVAADLPTSISSESNVLDSSSHSSRSTPAEVGSKGLLIDLESVTGTRMGRTTLSVPSGMPGSNDRSLPAFPIVSEASEGSEGEPRLLTSSSTQPHLETPALLRKSREPSHRDRPPRLRMSSSEDHRKRLSDERQRVRADESTKDEVIRRLRADQQCLPKSPSNRTPRAAISPPLAPPPPFAPPLAPHSPSSASLRSRGSSSLHSPRFPLTRKPEDVDDSARTWPTSMMATIITVPPTPVTPGPQRFEQAPTASADWLSDLPRVSESGDSVRTSMQTLSLWEYADSVTQHDSFARTSSLVLPASKGKVLSHLNDDPSGTATPVRARSRSASSVLTVSPDRYALASSSSRGSIDAPSIFDKELPLPPGERQDDQGDHWFGPVGSPDSVTHPAAPWIGTASSPRRPQKSRAGSPAHEEMQGLREQLARAEERARAAEESAKMAVLEAQSEKRRLAQELAKAEQASTDKMEAEAVRRAKWAKEQAARNQLEAYERSKLEADEMRRRRAIEEQRQLECDRANRIREEREWCQQEAARVKREYEVKIQVLAEREAKLKAEAEAKERLERERREQVKAREAGRQERLERLASALREAEGAQPDAKTEPLLTGWLNLQDEGEVHRRRRWYRVMDKQLALSKSPTDPNVLTSIPLDPIRLLSISDGHEDSLMSHALCLEVQQATEIDTKVDGAAEMMTKRTYIISTDTLEAKEEIELVVEAIRGL
ncbi:helicase SWR1 [Pseudozyma hubeiensis SY62]|uniref:Helicase SWR1 n=1 Tax=Pseudozyma hubeiensis (strain SY62) TaxID=1305764 RepID=R9P7A0_PSEHS|nr:helicase SWR1 [Pseudozyma hubeiensis SY62]GAC97231.1 helicase SWR1 [Pseudozyma hubeiensis SY62]